MRILLDECVHAGVKSAFPGPAVRTVVGVGWGGSAGGPLLAHAQESFDVFVTIDRRLEHQHDLKALRLGLGVVHVPDNQISSYQAIFAELVQAVESVKRGQVMHVNP